jgi:hypothetical protein
MKWRAAIIALLLSGAPTLACAVCTLDLSKAFEVSHPRALTVACAITEARADGALADDSPAPHDPRTWAAIREFVRRWAGCRSGNLRLICVDIGRTVQFELTGGAARGITPTDVARDVAPDCTVVTAVSVLRGLQVGTLEWEGARSAGWILVDGELRARLESIPEPGSRAEAATMGGWIAAAAIVAALAFAVRLLLRSSGGRTHSGLLGRSE